MCARKVIAEFLLIEIWRLVNQFLAPIQQWCPGHFGDKLAHSTAETTDGQVFVAAKHFVEAQSVRLLKGSFEQRRRYLEADEVMVAVGRVAVLGHLDHVESKLSADVCLG